MGKPSKDKVRVYFIGIGGIGMCGVAGIAKSLGFEIFGSEGNSLYPPSSSILEALEIKVFSPSEENLLKINPQIIVVGNAVREDHPEVLAAQKRNLKILSFPQFIEHFLLPSKKSLVVAGTHGKTTTSSILAYSLNQLNLEPSFLVGGVLKNYNKNFEYSQKEWVVLEGDEYPSAFFDRVPKFFHYQPYGLILTSLEFDHGDVYKNLEELKNTFKQLLQLIKKEGILVYNQDDSNLRDLIKEERLSCKIITYGKSQGSDYQLLENLCQFKKGFFLNKGKFRDKEGKIWEIEIPIPGEHNLLNALGCLALLLNLGLEPSRILESFKSFKGVKRRQEIVFFDKNTLVIDDFAHHPTAVKITLEELKKAYQPERTLLFFEPRTNTSKRKFFQKDYALVLSLADFIVLKIPPQLENIPLEERIDFKQLKENLKKGGKEVFILKDIKELKKIPFNSFFEDTRRKLIVFMSSAYMKKEIEWIKNWLI